MRARTRLPRLAPGSDTINNAAATTFALATQDKYVVLQSDGVSAWDVIANN
jgi:hypothetical protein